MDSSLKIVKEGCVIPQISRQILSYNQNKNKNSSADWSVWNLRGKTIKTKKNSEFSNIVKKCDFPAPFTHGKKILIRCKLSPIWKVHKIAVKTVKAEWEYFSYSCFALMRNSSIWWKSKRHSKTFFFLMTTTERQKKFSSNCGDLWLKQKFSM